MMPGNESPFIQSESGAVTVDWVVLTAALVGLGLAVMGVVSTGVQDVSGDMRTQLEADDIIQTSFLVGAPAPYSAFDQNRFDSGYGELMRQDHNGDYVHSEADILSYHDSYAGSAAVQIANGDQALAETFMDYAASVEASAQDRGIDLSGSDHSVDAARSAYAEAFPEA